MAAPSDSDVIAAIATAQGRAGIGIVRISGRSLDRFASQLLGAAPALLHGCGIALVAARISHALGLASTAGVSVGRSLGVTVNFAVILVLAWVDIAAFLH